MYRARVGSRLVWLLALALVLSAPSLLSAQSSSSSGSSSNSNNNNNGFTNQAGVTIDAEGVLRTKMFADPGGPVDARAGGRGQGDARPQGHQLQQAAEGLAQPAGAGHSRPPGQRLTDEMRYLAGLQRVRYVFYYPDSKDIVLAGPAEGWVTDLAGRIVGIDHGPARRAVAGLGGGPAGVSRRRQARRRVIGCSIDPTQEGLAAMQQFLRSNRLEPPVTRADQFIVNGVRNSLGLPGVTVNGVSPKTHFAQVMVEADYRMKLIGIGLETPPVQVGQLRGSGQAERSRRNALQRWFFVPDYQCVRVSEDDLAMELVGDGVKLVGEDEVGHGQRPAARRPAAATRPARRSC